MIDKGTHALRGVLQTIAPSLTLSSLLKQRKSLLLKLRPRVINDTQWELLFPRIGPPDLERFDITLLTILLQNICGLPTPAAGWKAPPRDHDTSIKNMVIHEAPHSYLDDAEFHSLWLKIARPLIRLGIPQQDIDELKQAPLSPDEEYFHVLEVKKKEK